MFSTILFIALIYGLWNLWTRVKALEAKVGEQIPGTVLVADSVDPADVAARAVDNHEQRFHKGGK